MSSHGTAVAIAAGTMTTAATFSGARSIQSSHEQVIRVCADVRDLARSDTNATIDLAIHDTSRLEWTAIVPLDTPDYELEVELELPASAAAPDEPWAYMQSLARLETNEANLLPDDATLGALHRHAVGVAARLAWSSAGFARHCERIKTFVVEDIPPGAAHTLMLWLDAALARFDPTRRELAHARAPGPANAGANSANDEDEDGIVRERALVDEYWSAQLVHMLTGAAQSLRDVRRALPSREDVDQAMRPVEDRVYEALAREMRDRRDKGYIDLEDGSTKSLERYIERSSLLKKHFQEALFLEPDGYQVHERVHTWVSSLVAIVAGMWAFGWQLVLLRDHSTGAERVSWGLVMLSMFAGCIYATRERIKEVGRAWIEGRVHRFYAHRVARYRAPARMLAGRNVLVSARESFDRADIVRPSMQDEGALVTLPRTALRFVHRGKLRSIDAARGLGATAVREVFRYDLSPIFQRLHDDVKPVALLDSERRTVRLADAPRLYRLPVRVTLTLGRSRHRARVRELTAVVVVNKKGLVRVERRSGAAIF